MHEHPKNIGMHLSALMQFTAWRSSLAVWLKGVRLEAFFVLEIERRPRGASRAEPAPTSVSGQLGLEDHLDRLGGTTTNLQ
ncbi:hypothetical protein [Pseudomonas sp. TE3610]